MYKSKRKKHENKKISDHSIWGKKEEVKNQENCKVAHLVMIIFKLL